MVVKVVFVFDVLKGDFVDVYKCEYVNKMEVEFVE